MDNDKKLLRMELLIYILGFYHLIIHQHELSYV